MEITSYEYKGYTLVVFPSGKVMVHEGIGETPPTGKLVQDCDNLRHGMSYINSIAHTIPADWADCQCGSMRYYPSGRCMRGWKCTAVSQWPTS
jgi:hypothetical protein